MRDGLVEPAHDLLCRLPRGFQITCHEARFDGTGLASGQREPVTPLAHHPRFSINGGMCVAAAVGGSHRQGVHCPILDERAAGAACLLTEEVRLTGCARLGESVQRSSVVQVQRNRT